MRKIKKRRSILLRVSALAVLVGLAGTLCGCMQAVRLKDRAIVQAAGVDYDEQAKKFRLTFQYFVPEGGGGTTTFDASKPNNDIIESEGATMTEAVDNATLAQGKQIFFGSNKIIVLGKSLAEHGVREAVDYFGSSHQMHPSVFMLISQGEAAEIVSAQISRGIVPASAIEQVAQTGQTRHHIEGGRLVDVMARLQNAQSAVTLPVIRLENLEEDKQEVRFSGGAILKDGKLADTLEDDEIEGALWLSGKTSGALLTIDVPSLGVCSLEILDSQATKKPRLEGGRIVFYVDIRCDALLRETSAPVGAPGVTERLDEIEAAMSADIRDKIGRVVERSLWKNGADILKLQAQIRKDLPGYWAEHQKNPQAMLENTALDLKINCNISRMGLEATDKKG